MNKIEEKLKVIPNIILRLPEVQAESHYTHAQHMHILIKTGHNRFIWWLMFTDDPSRHVLVGSGSSIKSSDP